MRAAPISAHEIPETLSFPVFPLYFFGMNRPPATVLYDGVCNLCSATVRFIVKRDPEAHFRFAPLQSDIGRGLLTKYGLPADEPASIVLIENDTVFVKNDAALHIARGLKGLWPALAVLRIVPRVIRDGCYDFTARHRYRWFGRKEVCERPGEDLRNRFL
jgi:predicted DCC family thiol-disulfide oxidoreductase YuxK